MQDIQCNHCSVSFLEQMEISKGESLEDVTGFISVIIGGVWRHQSQLGEQCPDKHIFWVVKGDIFDDNSVVNRVGGGVMTLRV